MCYVKLHNIQVYAMIYIFYQIYLSKDYGHNKLCKDIKYGTTT